MSLLDTLPPVIKKEVDLSDVKVAEQKDEVDKPYLLCCSRALKPEEMDLLRSYGKVLVWHESFRNIPLAQHEFLFCIFDLEQKVHRDTLGKEDLTAYHVVCIVGLLDSYDDFADDLGAENLVRTLPQRQAFRTEFCRLLLSPKIRKPSIGKILLRFLCGLARGLESK